MMFSPHTLQKKVPSTETEDEYGHPVIGNDTWIDVCMCRCDDNTTKEFKKENGDVYSYRELADELVSYVKKMVSIYQVIQWQCKE